MALPPSLHVGPSFVRIVAVILQHVVPLVAVVLLGACARKVECTSEVTSGSGTYKATATGSGERAMIVKLALRNACERMCEASKSPAAEACAPRCVIDAGAGKIGARTICKP